MSTETNKIVYSKKESANHFNKDKYLLAAEKSMLNAVANEKLDTMLDIGVGAGRTTLHYAKYFKKYIAIDYSESMIAECRSKFKGLDYTFEVMDARDLTSFSDETFDFVLFSFNGIDCVSYSDRELILNEIFRVLKKGGQFFFSVHNFYNIPKLFSFQMPKNPLKWLREIKRFRIVNKLNPAYNMLNSYDYYEIKDGDFDFKTSYIYIKPEKQIMDLKQVGFNTIIGFDLIEGNEIHNYATNTDPWIHFKMNK